MTKFLLAKKFTNGSYFVSWQIFAKLLKFSPTEWGNLKEVMGQLIDTMLKDSQNWQNFSPGGNFAYTRPLDIIL